MKSSKDNLLACLALAFVAGCGGTPALEDTSVVSSDVTPAATAETDPVAEDVISAASDAAAKPERVTAKQTDAGSVADAASQASDAAQLVESTDAGVADSSPAPEGARATPPMTTTAAKLGRASLGNSPLPCDLRTVIETSCQSCHARDPGALAPMALTSIEDLLAPSVTQPERKVHELMKERVHSVDAPMPPASSRKLTPQELATFDSKLVAEIAAGPAECAGAAARRAMFPAPDPSEIEQCYPFYAYESSGRDISKPYNAPNGENYVCFTFDIPWSGEAQALSARVKTSPIVHHWRLFDQQLAIPQGTVLVAPGDCSVGATTTYVNGDFSDQKEINMPPMVGLEMPAAGTGLKMMLSIHYFNTGEAIDDASGVEVCTARKPREHTAGVHAVAATKIELPPNQESTVTARCTPKYSGDIHIFQSLPHMHTRGTRLSTVVERVNGTRETLIDVPFDFNNQIPYQTDMVLKPGDILLTTCHFLNDTDRTIVFGASTEDEMCLNDITAWPAGSLLSGDLQGGKGCYE